MKVTVIGRLTRNQRRQLAVDLLELLYQHHRRSTTPDPEKENPGDSPSSSDASSSTRSM